MTALTARDQGMAGAAITVFACGDVMTGRGIDQILPHPGEPELREASVTDARDYVRLAERASGPIPRPVSFSWPWGDAVGVIEDVAPDARIINLETSITRSSDFAPGKAVTYRMSPANMPCVSAVSPHVCALANNHVLDFGRAGLAETLACLAGAGLNVAGAGPDASAAVRPAAVEVPGGGRVLVYACADASSGVPPGWAAAPGRSGVNLLAGLSGDDADLVLAAIGRCRREGDLAVVSVHWGANWGYGVDGAQVAFAHRLIDGGVDLIHGHSSHHPRPVEVYRGRLILYGCGDCVDDYEGITGYEEFRDDLRLLFFASLSGSGALEDLRMVPMQARKMRLRRAGEADAQWLTSTLTRIGRRFGSRFTCLPDGVIALSDA